MVSGNDRRQTEVTRDGPTGVLAEHSTDDRPKPDAAENRSGSWGTNAHGTQSREGEAGHHVLDSGPTIRTQSCTEVFVKLDQIAEQAACNPDLIYTSLAHLMTPDFLCAAFYRLRQDAAPGFDGVTAKAYAENLESNTLDLWERLRTMQYKAPPVTRIWIEKEDGKQRPLGLPTLEDKIVQRAAMMILEPIFEADFYDFSYGFRRGRKSHDALVELRNRCMKGNINWIVDADVSGYFDNIDRGLLMNFLRTRVNDGSLCRLISKWLHAGVLEDGELTHPDQGTPQGGVISPLLANIFLHHVLDRWFMEEIRPQLKGDAFLIRFADDFIIGCQEEEDAVWLMEQLRERFSAHKLTIHPEKSRLIEFSRPSGTTGPAKEAGSTGSRGSVSSAGLQASKKGSNTFDFLGFTHYWARSRRGFWVLKRRTMKKRQRRACRAIWTWCRNNRHMDIRKQHRRLRAKLYGHYQYYGIRCNFAQLRGVWHQAKRAWRYWLSRRCHRDGIPWEKFKKHLEKFPLPEPRVVHSI